MERVAGSYLKSIGSLQKRSTSLDVIMISSVTGALVGAETLCHADYWVQDMTNLVNYAKAASNLSTRTNEALRKRIDKSHKEVTVVQHLFEIGPHPVLQMPTRQCAQLVPRIAELGYSSCLRRDNSACISFLGMVDHLYSLGTPMDLREVNDPLENGGTSRRILTDLPPYHFHHARRFWHKIRLSTAYRFRNNELHRLPGVPSNDCSSLDAR